MPRRCRRQTRHVAEMHAAYVSNVSFFFFSDVRVNHPPTPVYPRQTAYTACRLRRAAGTTTTTISSHLVDPPSMPSSSSAAMAADVAEAAVAEGARPKNTILAEAGKAAWYDAQGRNVGAYIIGIAGGSSSGKTSVARALVRSLPHVPWMAIVSVDSFYRPLSAEQSAAAFESRYDFDHPGAFDTELLVRTLRDLKAGRAAEVPVYSFAQHQRLPHTTYLYGANVVLLEGLFVLQEPALRELLDMKVFVQADADLMLARRIRRDVLERGRDVDGILRQYLTFVKPSQDHFVAPQARFADIIVPGLHNDVAVKVIGEHIRVQLQSQAQRIRTALSRFGQPDDQRAAPDRRRTREYFDPHSGLLRFGPADGDNDVSAQPYPAPVEGHSLNLNANLPPTVHVLPQTRQVRALLTSLHDAATDAEEFVFNVHRLTRLVVEGALSLLPYAPKDVPLALGGAAYPGSALAATHLCSVAVLRSGGVFEASLRRAVPDLPLGALLIQSGADGEPYLYTVQVPPFLKRRAHAEQTWVILCDAQIGTGAAAFMAVRVLLDHGVPPSQIVFLALLASAQGGVHALAQAFPELKIVVAGVDPGLKRSLVPDQDAPSLRTPDLVHHAGDRLEQKLRVCWALIPGMGNIGNRYWRT